MGQAGEELMAQLKSFYDLVNELSMKTDKNLKNLKIPVKGPKGTSKHMRMKVATHDAPGAGDIKKAVNSSVQSADRKPEKYLKPDGKVGVRMVRVDKEVINKEASVLKPTKPSDITKHARTLAKNSGDYERNKKKYIDKARAKVFRMYPKESLNGLMKEATHKTDSFIGHSHAKRAGMKVVKHSSGVTGDNVTISHPDPKKLQKYVDNHLGGGKIKEDMSINEKMLPIVKVMRKNKRLIDNELGNDSKNYKAYVMIDDEYLDRLNDSQSELVFSSLKKNKGVAYPENDITAYFKSENNAKQFVKDLGGPASFRGRYGRLDINLTPLGRGIKKESIEATWPDEMPPINEDKYTYFDTKDDAHAHAKKHGGKVYTNTGKGATKVKGKPVNTHVVIKDDVDEALNMQQRMKRSRLMKRMKTRIAIGRKRASRKMANKKTLEKRSMRQARNEIAKKLTRGIPKAELTFARKKEIEKRLEKPALQQRIKRLAKRKFKDVRKKEVQRKKG